MDGVWHYSPDHQQPCQILETQSLWGESEKAAYAFAVRRQHIERLGLPEVRHYRLQQLIQEEAAFQAQWAEKSQTQPELTPLLILRVEGAA